ncbi:class I SAM-dependent methyltransferase [Candidatus Sumerlaeota bacterium]|nr:class I SAM-dependent methyltransferase [Candidatus Sumerlaeota bacterium]
MDWFKKAFGPLYPDVYGHRDENDARRAVDFLERHCDPRGERVLDLCCGAGRHGLEWLRRGRDNIVGFDLSETLLSEARRSCEEEELCFPLVRGDMRCLPFADGAFALVVNLFTSFGYFASDSENELVFAEVGRVLRPESGRLVLDHIHPPWLRGHLEPETRRTTSGGLDVRETRHIDETRRRVVKRVEVLGGAATGDVPHEWTESVRFYAPDEIEEIGRRHGFGIESAHGDFDGSPLSNDSPRAIYRLVVARASRP